MSNESQQNVRSILSSIGQLEAHQILQVAANLAKGGYPDAAVDWIGSNFSSLAGSQSSRSASLLLDLGCPDLVNQLYLELDTQPPEGIAIRLRSHLDPESTKIPVYVINSSANPARWNTASFALKNGGFENIHRIEAALGRTLPGPALTRLVPNRNVAASLGPGGVGCWLSHVRAWETIVNADSKWSIVAEDDVALFSHSTVLTELGNELDRYDLIWINERMSGIFGIKAPSWETGVLDPWDQIANWSPHRTSWGTDGYLISRDGAAKLYEFCSSTGIEAHIDGQMAAFSTEVRGEPQNMMQRTIRNLQLRLGVEPGVRSACLNVPVLKEADFGFSARRNEDNSRG